MVSFSLGGLGAFLPINFGNLRFQVTQAKGNDKENGGFSPDFSPELSPKTLGKKGSRLFVLQNHL